MIKLTITEKGGEPKALSFDKDEISIGRVAGNDIVLPKGNVSKRHSKIVQREGRMEIADLKSTNGTYVNGRKIAEPILVSAADKIYVGDFMIVLEGEAALTPSGENGHHDAVASSGARKVPVPPPPPAPRSSSSLSRLPDDEGASSEDEEDLALAVRPPGAGRMPPPPPPSSRRTPIGNVAEALDEDGLSADAGAASDADDDEDAMAGTPALFERSPTRSVPADDEDDENAFKKSPVTANRHPGDLLAAMAVPDGAAARSATGPVSRPASDAAPAAPTFERGSSKIVPVSALGDGAEARPLEALDALMNDAAVSAIFILGPETTLVERGGKIEPHSTSLGDANAVAEAVWRIATTAVPPPPPDNPVIDVRLADGTRLAAAFPPAAPAGLCAAIRKAALPAGRSFADLGPSSTMTKDLQALLEAAIAGRRNVLCTGDAGAVTAVLAAAAGAIPAERRVVSVGAGTARSRSGWTELAPSADMPALVRVAAAFRADHLLIGEIAGAEVLDVLTAAARGQEGIVFGLPARSAAEALARVEALASRGAGSGGVAQLVDSTLDLVVSAASLADGGVVVAEIAEPRLDGGGKLASERVAVWQPDGDGKRARGAAGKQQVTGVSPRLAASLASSGSPLPSSLVRNG